MRAKGRDCVMIDLSTGKAELWENYRRVMEGDVREILRKVGIL